MTIGDRIKQLRKEKGITQEKLAEYLNITYQSVSKWENNTALPDISLVVPISNFFGISTDELLGMQNEKSKVIAEYLDKSAKLLTNGLMQEDYLLWREAVSSYPNDYECLINLARSLLNTQYIAISKQEKEANAEECVSVCNRILNDCNDDEVRFSAIQILTIIYSMIGNEEMAVKTAIKAPPMVQSREELLQHAYRNNPQKRKVLLQNNIQLLLDFIHASILTLTYDADTSTKIIALEKLLNIWNELYYDGNYHFYHCRIQTICQRLAYHYAQQANGTSTLLFLKKAKHHATQFDNLSDEGIAYTGIFFNLCSYKKESTTKTHPITSLETYQNFLNNKIFDFVRANIDF